MEVYQGVIEPVVRFLDWLDESRRVLPPFVTALKVGVLVLAVGLFLLDLALRGEILELVIKRRSPAK